MRTEQEEFDTYMSTVLHNTEINRPRKRKQTMIEVCIFEIATEQCIRRHIKNFDDDKVKQWLHDVTLWAISNGKSIKISKLA